MSFLITADNKLFKEIGIAKRKLMIRVDVNGTIKIEQSEPKKRIDFIEIEKNGNIKIYSEEKYKEKRGITIGELSEEKKVE